MALPFPGMDPYLEDRNVWTGFHASLAAEIRVQLNRRLPRRYYADLEVHARIEEIGVSEVQHAYSDAAVLETQDVRSDSATTTVVIPPAPVKRTAVSPEQTKSRTIQVRLSDGKRLVTSIELLSPANKRGRGLEQYAEKREKLLYSPVHLVEIDLLRGGKRPGWELQEPPLETEYVCLVNRADPDLKRVSEIWPVALNAPLPVLPVPLLAPDPDIALDLGAIVATVYDEGAYERIIDYAQPVPPPALRPEMESWIQKAVER